RKAVQAAGEEETILISGETGTGKGLLAKAMHGQSSRAAGLFMKVNCGALPEPLLESELFGHVKGAYTGAASTQDGFFQAATGGTLFLDEIDNTSFAMQAKLLQAIEDQEVWKVGARRPDQVKVRIITAANTSLEHQIETGNFREDLFYRLNVISLHMPPLRDRHEDILPLCYFFAEKWAQAHTKSVPAFSDAVLGYLQSYSWPGNVRELEHLITELLIYAPKNEITVEMLPARIRNPIQKRQVKPFLLEAIIKDHIHSICTSTNWNITQAASLLGLTRQALYRKLHQFNLGEY
ncbi:MAG: sigma-54 dependent transcriptional regulator, partial [Calditrichota bacterium]